MFDDNDDFPDDSGDDSGDFIEEYATLPCQARPNIRELVEAAVNVTQWHDDYAECACPAGHENARLYINGAVPHLHCLHEKCLADVAEVNARLRESARDNLTTSEWSSIFKPNKAEKARRKRLALILAQARNRLLPSLLKKGKLVTADDWLDRSPYKLDDRDVRDDWSLFLRALGKQRDPTKPLDYLNHDDLLWIGELWESGKPEYRRNFQSVGDWLKSPLCPGSQICVAPFDDSRSDRGQQLSDTWQRSKRWANIRSYYVAESDVLTVEQFGIVVDYLQRFSTLRAIVDTGGKSIHCWFDVPPPPRFPVQRPQIIGMTPEEHIEFEWAAMNWQRDSKAAEAMTRLTREAKERYAAFEPILEQWKKDNATHLEKHARQVAQHTKRVEEHYAVAEGLGCDRMMFRFCPTARLPGCKRLDAEGRPTGRWQKLLYLNPKYPLIL